MEMLITPGQMLLLGFARSIWSIVHSSGNLSDLFLSNTGDLRCLLLDTSRATTSTTNWGFSHFTLFVAGRIREGCRFESSVLISFPQFTFNRSLHLASSLKQHVKRIQSPIAEIYGSQRPKIDISSAGMGFEPTNTFVTGPESPVRLDRRSALTR